MLSRRRLNAGQTVRMDQRIVLNVFPFHQAAVADSVNAINSVHCIPESMPTIPIETDSTIVEQAGYFFHPDTHEPLRIALSTRAAHPAISLTHEMGHFIDHQGLAGPLFSPLTMTPAEWSSLPDNVREALTTWETRIRASDTYRILSDLHADSFVDVGGRTFDVSGLVPFLAYLLEPHELFARSYTQYIVRKSHHGGLAAELEGIVESQQNEVVYVPEHWTDDDFRPIMEAFDLLFGALGWLR